MSVVLGEIAELDLPGQGRVSSEDGAVGAPDFDGSVWLSCDGVAVFFVPVVGAARCATIVGIGFTTSPIQLGGGVSATFAVWGEVVDLAVGDVDVAAGPVTLMRVQLCGQTGVAGEQPPPAQIDGDTVGTNNDPS
jgi:hypothetical protein